MTEKAIEVLGSILGSELNCIQVGLERDGRKRLSRRISRAATLLQSVYEEMQKKGINFNI